jgi:hypothetical protein
MRKTSLSGVYASFAIAKLIYLNKDLNIANKGKRIQGGNKLFGHIGVAILLRII